MRTLQVEGNKKRYHCAVEKCRFAGTIPEDKVPLEEMTIRQIKLRVEELSFELDKRNLAQALYRQKRSECHSSTKPN